MSELTTKMSEVEKYKVFESILENEFKESKVYGHLRKRSSKHNSLTMSFLFDSLTVFYVESDNKWRIEIREKTENEILKLINSEFTFIEYIEFVEEVVSVLERVLPTFIAGSKTECRNLESIRKLSILFNMRELINTKTDFKTYLSTYERLVIPSLGLQISLIDEGDRTISSSPDSSYKILRIPYTNEATADDILVKYQILETLKSFSLQEVFYKENNPYEENFQDIFNLEMDKKVQQNGKFYIDDFHTEFMLANPAADLYSTHFLNATFIDSLELFPNSVPTTSWRTESLSTFVLKTLEGYYYIKDDGAAIGFISLEAYENIIKS